MFRYLKDSESRINTGFFVTAFSFAPHPTLDILYKKLAKIPIL